jgi:hypothetical protein
LSDVDVVVKHVCDEARELKVKMTELEEAKMILESLKSDLGSLEAEQDENEGAIELLKSRLEVEAILIEEMRVKMPGDKGGVKRRGLQSEISAAEQKRLEHEVTLHGLMVEEATLWKEIEIRKGEEVAHENRVKDLTMARDQIIENLINLNVYEVAPVAL